MGEVVGPFSPADWFTMGELKRDINWMKSKGYDKFELTIRYQTEQLRKYFDRKIAA